MFISLFLAFSSVFFAFARFPADTLTALTTQNINTSIVSDWVGLVEESDRPLHRRSELWSEEEEEEERESTVAVESIVHTALKLKSVFWQIRAQTRNMK